MQEYIKRTRDLTHRPIGVNLPIAFEAVRAPLADSYLVE